MSMFDKKVYLQVNRFLTAFLTHATALPFFTPNFPLLFNCPLHLCIPFISIYHYIVIHSTLSIKGRAFFYRASWLVSTKTTQ